MANQEHLAILKQGVGVWNQWRKLHPKVQPILNGIDLSETLLSGINLSKARLSDTDLSGAMLNKSDLSQADLT